MLNVPERRSQSEVVMDAVGRFRRFQRAALFGECLEPISRDEASIVNKIGLTSMVMLTPNHKASWSRV